MALRNQISETNATFPDPVLGVNLNSSPEDLQPGESPLMQNCVYYQGTHLRTGSQRLNSSSLGAYRVRGGHKFYYGGSTPVSKRLIAYNTNIATLNDAGTAANLVTTRTTDLDTHFLTWSITDKVYSCNGTDEIWEYDGTTQQLESAVAGSSQVPGNGGNAPARMMAPILDRIMCITTAGIERTSPRVAHQWSKNSSWATLRPSRTGLFTAIMPYTIKGVDQFYPGLIAFQANAYYVVTGTNFGSDATAASASTGEDSAIRLLDPNVGTSSPYAVETVPGVGMFWLTSDLNVYWLPEGSLTGKYIGNKLISTSATTGIENANTSQLNQAWMKYFYPYLMLGFPNGSDAYSTTQFWLDIRQFPENAVWYGPMTGQSVGRSWVEKQNGDNAIYGGEGNSATGAFVYKLRAPSRYTDAVGTADNSISLAYQTPYASFGWPSRQKYVYGVNFDLYMPTGSATCNLYDLDGALQSNLPISAVT